MGTTKRIRLMGTVITLGVVLAFAGMVASSAPVQADSHSTDGICDRT